MKVYACLVNSRGNACGKMKNCFQNVAIKYLFLVQCLLHWFLLPLTGNSILSGTLKKWGFITEQFIVYFHVHILLLLTNGSKEKQHQNTMKLKTLVSDRFLTASHNWQCCSSHNGKLFRFLKCSHKYEVVNGTFERNLNV